MPIVDAAQGSQSQKSRRPSEDGEASSSGAASSSQNGVAVAGQLNGGNWQQRIKALKDEAKTMRDERKTVMKRLKAAQRKNKRLRDRARILSEEDMLHILSMRRDRAASMAESASAASSSSGVPSSAVASSQEDHEPKAAEGDIMD